MLDDKRIKEAKVNMKIFLADKLITKERFRQVVFDTYVRNHKESLQLAEHMHNGNLSNLWTIVTSYYSMFYIANAVVYKLGFKIGSKLAHKVTSDALIELVRDKLKDSLMEDYENIKEEALEIARVKADEVVDSFDRERVKRSIFQYETTEAVKISKAKTSLQRAKEFSLGMQKLLDELNNK